MRLWGVLWAALMKPFMVLGRSQFHTHPPSTPTHTMGLFDFLEGSQNQQQFEQIQNTPRHESSFCAYSLSLPLLSLVFFVLFFFFFCFHLISPPFFLHFSPRSRRWSCCKSLLLSFFLSLLHSAYPVLFISLLPLCEYVAYQSPPLRSTSGINPLFS